MEQGIKRAFIGELLKRIRTDRSLQDGRKVTQADIAEALDIDSRSMVSMMEKGKASPPLEKIREFSHAYNTGDDLAFILFRDLAPVCWELMNTLLESLKYKGVITWHDPVTGEEIAGGDMDLIADVIQKSYSKRVNLAIPKIPGKEEVAIEDQEFAEHLNKVLK